MFLLYAIFLFALPIRLFKCATFLVNTKVAGFDDPEKCPNGFKLADLNDQAEWHLAARLATETLGPEQSAWINSGWQIDGTGFEKWTLITPIPRHSCEYPPKDLDSFCLPIYWARMSPNTVNGIKLPSICQALE